MSELGQKLKASRESRGLSIQEIALSIKISPRVLTALEAGDQKSLPAKTFLRGFVKSYSSFLRLDQVECLALFEKEYGGEVTSSRPVQSPPATEDSKRIFVEPLLQRAPKDETTPSPFAEQGFPWGKSVLAIVLLAGIVLIAKTVSKYQKERALPESEIVAAEGATPEQEASASPLIPVAVDGSLAVDTAGSSAVAGTTETPVSEETVAVATPSPATPSPTPVAATPTPQPVAAAATPSPTPEPLSTSAEPLSKRQEILIEASQSSSLSYDLGDGQMKRVDLKRGEIHILRSRRPITLEVEKPDGLTIFVNGKALSKAAGEPFKKRIPE